MTFTWRNRYSRVRKIPRHNLYLGRNLGGRPDIVTEEGAVVGALYTNGYRWFAELPDGDVVSGESQSQVAELARDTVYERWANAAADDDPSMVMHQWDASRPRSQKTSEARAEGQFGVGPSDVGSCEKAIEYRERPPEGHEPIDVPKDAAILGTLIHEALTEARRWRYPWRQFGVKVDIVGLDKPGEIDEWDPWIGRVTDYKTASGWKWDSIGDDGPPEYEWEQVSIYGKGLTDLGLEVKSVQLLYINRNNGLPEVFTRPYDEGVALRALSRLHAVMDALEDGTPLPRRRRDSELLGPSIDALCARYCPHVVSCWNLTEVPPGRSPESYLLVHDDADVEAVLVSYAEHRAAESAAKKEKERARVLVEGVPLGVYGTMLMKESGGNLKWKPDPERRVAQLEEAIQTAIDTGCPPPAPEELPYPESSYRTNKSVLIQRRRAADLEKEARQVS